ncbi:MAG: hypothetical protein ACYTG5_14230 [Planctomycetota bacterium]
MRSKLGVPGLVLLAALLWVPACVELTGQRISWFHDVAEDRLQFLIHYDGIHEGGGSRDKGSEQIPEFVANEEILIMDWIFHLDRSAIDEDMDPSGDWRRLIQRPGTYRASRRRSIDHHREGQRVRG